MIQAFQIENYLGDVLYLDIRKPEDTGFLVTSVTGLNYPSNEISSQTYSGFDGSHPGYQRIDNRNIVMGIMFYEDNINLDDVETLRWKLMRYFLPKKELKFTAINEHGEFWINGIVETCEINIFSQREAAQISIICPDPYFRTYSENQVVRLGFVEPNFEFEFPSEDSEPVPSYEKTIIPEITVSTDVNDYYAAEYTDVEVIRGWVGQQMMIIPGTEKLINKFTLNEAGGYTFEVDLPEDYGESYEIRANNVQYETELNQAGGYTVKTIMPLNNIEFGFVKEYPSTIIDYPGSVETGVQILVDINGLVSNLRISNKTTGEKIVFNDERITQILRSSLRKYDQIVIDTNPGKKSVKLIRDGLYYNIINACLPVNNWIQLRPGINEIVYTSTSGIENLEINMVYSIRYLGI